MCHFAMGLTHCYKTTVFFTFINKHVDSTVDINIQKLSDGNYLGLY